MGSTGGNALELLANDYQRNDSDMTTVLDAAGSEQVVLIETSNGSPSGIQYAARYPERIRAVVLINAYAHYVREDDYPWGYPRDALERFSAPAREAWGTGSWLDIVAPSKCGDDAFRSWWARCERLGIGPDQVAALTREAWERDVRHLLPTLKMPTLVLHREGDRYIRVGAGRYLGEHIPGAKYVELPGEDHFYFVGDTDGLVDEIEEFLTGSHQAPEGDVVTATVLFTDIVASTEQEARFGHRKWSAISQEHDAMIRAVLSFHRGHEVKSLGDGFLATFDATSRAVHAAVEIVAQARRIGIQVRAGVHTGEVEVRSDDVSGLAIAIAKRICDFGGSDEVLVSGVVPSLVVGSTIEFEDRGEHELKGVPGLWRLFAIAQ
jgi:class 3 adenylate cyclase